jgi:hypothetical protein
MPVEPFVPPLMLLPLVPLLIPDPPLMPPALPAPDVDGFDDPVPMPLLPVVPPLDIPPVLPAPPAPPEAAVPPAPPPALLAPAPPAAPPAAWANAAPLVPITKHAASAAFRRFVPIIKRLPLLQRGSTAPSTGTPGRARVGGRERNVMTGRKCRAKTDRRPAPQPSAPPTT